MKNGWVWNGKWQRKELLSDLITANYLTINVTNGTQMSKYFWFQDIFESASCGVQQSTGRRPIGPTRVQGRIILFLGIEIFNVVKENYVARLKILHLFIFSLKPRKILLFFTFIVLGACQYRGCLFIVSCSVVKAKIPSNLISWFIKSRKL